MTGACSSSATARAGTVSRKASATIPPDRLRFLGALPPDRLAACYAAADLMVWPAINEAYGMALLEAQAAGLPVVAGRTGGVPDIVRDGVTGLLTPIGDETAFAEAGRIPVDGRGAPCGHGQGGRPESPPPNTASRAPPERSTRS